MYCFNKGVLSTLSTGATSSLVCGMQISGSSAIGGLQLPWEVERQFQVDFPLVISSIPRNFWAPNGQTSRAVGTTSTRTCCETSPTSSNNNNPKIIMHSLGAWMHDV